MTSSILITGGSGLIGQQLTDHLLKAGHRVSHLGRSRRSGKVATFTWDPEKRTVDEDALHDVDVVVHLAGANVGEKRWTSDYKKKILESRTLTTAFLCEVLRTRTHKVKHFIAGSAIGYYGFEVTGTVTEDSPPGEDFLARVVKAWESEADKIASLGIRLVKIRTGIVLSDRGGALCEIARPVRWGVGAALGSGKQLVSWIHIDDLCRTFVKAVEDVSLSGPYNATGPYAVSNKELTKAVARVLKRSLWMPPVPGFVLQIILGEMADVVLSGCDVSSARIQKTGFSYLFPTLDKSVEDLLGRSGS